jgi:hypothetical protein
VRHISNGNIQQAQHYSHNDDSPRAQIYHVPDAVEREQEKNEDKNTDCDKAGNKLHCNALFRIPFFHYSQLLYNYLTDVAKIPRP